MDFNRNIKTLVNLAFAATIIVGCQANSVKTQLVSKEMAPYPLTPQLVGHKRKTKDLKGNVHTVELVSVENDLYKFESDDGSEWTNYTNPVLPSPAFSGPDWGAGTQEMTKVEGALFPLTVGNKMSFTVEGESTTSTDGWTEVRSCKVESQERVTVPAGEFDTFKIVCKSKWRNRITFFAPELNDIVLYRNTHKTEPKKSSGWELIETQASTR